MATEVSISSNALLRLGAEPINSFDEADLSGSNIERARLAANLWPTVRKAVLRAHSWHCATKRAILSPDSTPPAFGFVNRFLIPSDWLRTLQVGQEETDLVKYRTEGRYWLCDEDAFYIAYIFDNTVPATYDNALVNALELAMTAVMAYPVTKSTALRDSFNQDFVASIKAARTTDSQDDPPETMGNFPLLEARFSGGITL